MQLLPMAKLVLKLSVKAHGPLVCLYFQNAEANKTLTIERKEREEIEAKQAVSNPTPPTLIQC